MPHCVIEYSKELEKKVSPQTLISHVYQGALASDLFEGPDIKTRTLSYEHHQTGDERLDFIHVSVRILSGRTDVQKQALSHSVLSQLQSLSLQSVSLTVEILDIDRSSYAKHVA
ncbi:MULTISPECIES: 5-carboxymethyl-2-hydroxymuconate Delta-isomerase [Photobacterium]|uniref:5-carboxymethyl-2-hydroxymuconate Delta-isomerase n=1 Tax=Photobacterium TaxID=657 RepID=UPI001A8D7F59|nr:MULTISPECIES: 5-carboxymethyl-2-hydroxymuconate isomerase [Photobacterium]QSV15171.1 5-carboxymethyl-2-hydroxymuconate isomerase [Photobacterium ganghwense]